MGIVLHARVQLVPPSLKVIAGLITHGKKLQYVVVQLENYCYLGNSYSMLRQIGYPQVKVATSSLGHGLTVAYTETLDPCDVSGWTRAGLVWVSEISCHPLCAFLGRICQGNLSSFEWLEKIEKKHREWLDNMPAV